MCGRFTLKAKQEKIEKEFKTRIEQDSTISERFNIVPSQMVSVVRDTDGERILSTLKWGLIPSWSKDESMGNKLINARAETLTEKPSFREAFARRRCIVPASGFYEWQVAQGKTPKQPFYFYLKEKDVFGFAGLWEEWLNKQTGELTETCTIITTQANATLKPVHNRMPVILKDNDYDLWMDEKVKDKSKLQNLLVPYSAKEMESHAVSRNINNPSIDSEALITPLNSL